MVESMEGAPKRVDRYMHDDTPKRWQRIISHVPAKNQQHLNKNKKKNQKRDQQDELALPGESYHDYTARLQDTKRRREEDKKMAEIDEMVREDKRTIRPKRREYLSKRKQFLRERKRRVVDDD